MADIKVRDLTDTSSIALDNQVMVLTNDEQNQVQNVKVSDLLTNVLSSDNGNVLEKGTDGKLYVETPENITGELADLATTDKTTLVAAINEVDSDIATEVANRVNAVSDEATTRANADNNLQSQIDAITAASDVTDVVGTYAELQAYDTTGLADNSIIKVLRDESRQNKTTYYRWVITGGVGAWVLIGEEGPFTTIAYVDGNFVTKNTVGNLNNLATSDKSSVVNAINELSNVLDPTQTADYIKNSKGLESGEISTNASILPWVEEMSHSTFDVSKFTVVGTPAISDNGIASGITINSIDLNFDRLNLYNASTWSVEFGIYVNSNNGTTYTDNTGINLTNTIFPLNGGLYLAGDGRIKFYRANVWAVQSQQFNVGDFVKAKLTYDNTIGTYSVYVSANGSGYTPVNTYTPPDEDKRISGMSTSGNIHISSTTTGGASVLSDAELDLKYISIMADGVEVFSGNKTGIDTIKPDDYTIVGTPTISADGVALTGYGRTDNSNKFSSNQFDVLSNNQQFECMAYIEPLPSDYAYPNQGQNVCSFNQSNNHIRIMRVDLTNLNTIRLEQQVNGSWAGNSGSTSWGLGTSFEGWIKLRIHYDTDDTCYKCDCYTINDGVETFVKTMVCNYTGSATTGTDWIFKNEYGQYQNYGKIDLNSIKVYDNNNLVYQPCLKIPYTESKTGSKVVNSIYRDRIFDMYEQFGYAPYYTLSDSDFTLPMGEVYGMIERKADASLLTGKADKDLNNVPASKGILTESYVNGTSWYRVYSDKFCVQGGLATTSSSVSSITLLKEYADTNYTIVATSRHDTSTAGGVSGISSYDVSATGFKLFINQDSGSFPRAWVTYGYIA